MQEIIKKEENIRLIEEKYGRAGLQYVVECGDEWDKTFNEDQYDKAEECFDTMVEAENRISWAHTLYGK